MNAQGHIIVPLERKGKDAVHIEPTVSNIEFAEGQVLDESLEVRAYRGSEQITLTTSMVAVTYTPQNVTVGYSATNGVVLFGISRSSSDIKVDSYIEYTVTIDDVVYTKVCGVKSVFNGEDGEPGEKGEKGDPGDPGEPGEDAICYELELSCETLEYNAFADAFAPSTITVQVLKVVGTTRSYVEFNLNIACMGERQRNALISVERVTSYTFSPTIRSGANLQYNLYFMLEAIPTENTAVQLAKTIYPNTSYYPRVRYWEDVADGGQFCQGKLGEQYRDIVIYPKSDDSHNYFYCRTSHTKSDDKVPVGDIYDQYWKTVSYFEVVATGLLLAETAKINNLYVDDVFMVRENTAIWIDPLNEGMKINSTSKLTGGEDINDQNAEDWANPTTWFHGAPVPTVDQIYGQTTVGTNDRTISSGRMYRNTNTNAVRVDSSLYSTTSPLVSSLPVGRTLIIATSERIEKAFRMVEGEYTTTSFGLTQSTAQIFLYKIVDGVQSRLMQVGVIMGAGQDNEEGETFLACPKFSIAHTNLGTATQQVQVALGIEGGQFMAGAELYLDESITFRASVSMLTEGYVSQFGADGIFLGYDSYNYLMHKLSESLTQHTLLANNLGIDITQQGSMQVVGGNKMPLGGLLLNGYISSTTQFSYWTFDGSTLAFSHTATGTYTIKLPSSWSNIFGGYYAAQSSVQATLINVVGCVRVSQDSESGYWGVINVYTYNTSGTLTDCRFYVSLHYASGYNTITYNALQSTTEAETINEE